MENSVQKGAASGKPDEILEEVNESLVKLELTETGSDSASPSSSSKPPSTEPTIRLLPFECLRAHREFPRYPNHATMIRNFKEVDHKTSLVVFISHCWLRGGDDSAEWEGFPHPDSKGNAKWELCVDAIERIWRTFAPSMESVYVWFDYSCIDQDAPNPGLELQHLDRIMQSCDCVLTPIVDPDWMTWGLHLSGNLFVDYRAERWRRGPTSYLHRAWCRMEMLYAATVPLLPTSQPGQPRYQKFQGGLKTAADQSRRPHILFGTKEYQDSKQLLMLPPLRKSYFLDFNPEEGVVRYEEDRAKIRSLMTELMPYKDLQMARLEQNMTQYYGETDKNGRYHGFGTLHYSNGDVYTGHFDHGDRHGFGQLKYANGDSYTGTFTRDCRHGNGIMRYSNGNVYTGTFDSNYRHGKGVLAFADGSVYDGSFHYGYQHGHGHLYKPNGDYYVGNFVQDRMDGQGVLYKLSGEVQQGKFRRGVFSP